MRSRSMRISWIYVATFFLLIGCGLFVRLSQNKSHEFSQECLAKNHAASPVVLRGRVIRNYLKLELKNGDERRKNGATIKLLLIQGDLSRESLRQMLLMRSLPAWLSSSVKNLSTVEQIDALSDEELTHDLVFANHDVWGRDLAVIPASSIQSMPRPSNFVDDLDELRRGFGSTFFSITQFWGLSLACCDGLSDNREDELRALNNALNNVNVTQSRFLVSSLCGDILVRKRRYGDQYIFNK